ncbi:MULTISPECIES: hypothetical protein [Trichocoleus]|uniref:Uncharacterized protein n=1 Tax=Trichocoleus desertorum GB2-A4 TaxID=2933944 RepID=A0ABV0JCK6_9CYAN|nr:hypothetical protein [Trichocoleus sp. FACHB-46]MBD1864158.1 hypothetical protein [Trichocoleus sp. FACHB-46]
MDSAVEYANRVEQCRLLLSAIAPQQIVEVLQEQMAFEAEEMEESELEEGITEMLWDYPCFITSAKVNSKTQSMFRSSLNSNKSSKQLEN